ncbi:MAG: NAD(P)-binding domain-containing protein [Sandaracinus sp.]|nr:NAD(P)-binding domain-containing protein [Myxococcales bacterium]MCB9600068.1 NAD(P)-binding domain-containing protein [Sandaracinus sp.]MCB9618519.1 NAD(P)-binding domain-containing protein [Sandaracinus sp.]MCB9622081.1 NAD(P)-binding domain-containing protein [Sandaracinus sp.]MCB9630628.1 NAD(P)-binding domain-containing protein [Sandaracinus sp.]
MSTSWIFGGMFLIAIAIYWLVSRREDRKEEKAASMLEDLAQMGEVVPDSIHPRIDPNRCIGSGACVRACPEQTVISIAGGVAQLTNPLACVGHGACEAACPVGAIQLVFGTATRGVELPRLDPTFQTTRPGVYVIGELGGMGLIRNAVMQGTQAADQVIASGRRGMGETWDAIVVGAGPAGIAAALRLIEGGLRILLLDRETFGGTILHYPRAKVVMTGTLTLPLYGAIRKRRMSKEELVELWTDIRKRVELPFVEGELIKSVVAGDEDHYEVRSESGELRRAANVLLALGRRGSPRKLGVPGENQGKVVYRVLEPDVFANQDVLVVGGGNGAVETALALADHGACRSVAISYRRGAFHRCRGDNLERITAAIDAGRVRTWFDTEVREILPTRVVLQRADGERVEIRNDTTVVQVGGTPPGEILGDFGVEIVTKFGER